MSSRMPGVLDGGLHEGARRHALQHGVDGGEHYQRPRLGADGQAGQRADAAGDQFGLRRDAVVGHAVPGREGGDGDVGGEEFQALLQGFQAPVVTRDVEHGGEVGGAGNGLLRHAAEHERVEAFRHAGEQQVFGAGIGWGHDVQLWPDRSQR
jgi:hypothetical protein